MPLCAQPFIDADFIPSSVALSADARRAEAMQVAQWKPPSDAMPGAVLFPDDGPLQCDLTSGVALDDRWLASAIALVATRPELIVHLFASTEFAERGILTLRLFKHGKWQPVTVDTMLPCRADGSVAFVSDASGASLWPSLLVKALAKLHGAYSTLSDGSVRCRPPTLPEPRATSVLHDPRPPQP